MLSKRLLILTAILLAPALHASTVVEPVLSGAVTWTREGAPYYLTKDTRLVPGAQLVVHPGVMIEVSGEPDRSVPGGTPLVDFIIQGDLQVLGSDFAPVSMTADKPKGKWGALYVLPPAPITWTSFYTVGGQLILGKGTLRMNYCGVREGRGVVLMAGADLHLEECQIDENNAGLMFLDATATATMNRTRFRHNEVGVLYRAPGVLNAVDCSIYDSRKYHAVNMTRDPVEVPAIWWGEPDGRKVMKRVLDGRRKRGLGLFRFASQLKKDPMFSTVKGFVPGQDPQRTHRKGPRFVAGPLFQVVMPSLNIQDADLKMSLGYGIQGGFVLPKDLEVRGTFQTVSFSAVNEERRSSLHLNFLRFGVLGRKRIPIGKARRTFLFAEGGGLLGMTQQDLTRPRDPWDIDSPSINRKIRETNLHLAGGIGGEFQIGKHRVELGVHYEMVPLNDDRGGSFLPIQGGLNLYF